MSHGAAKSPAWLVDTLFISGMMLIQTISPSRSLVPVILECFRFFLDTNIYSPQPMALGSVMRVFLSLFAILLNGYYLYLASIHKAPMWNNFWINWINLQCSDI